MSEYKMVTVVATEEMCEAARKWQETKHVCDPLGDRTRFYSGIYTAMLAAAPPFVVTDEMVEMAILAYRKTRWSPHQAENPEAVSMRAAIDAALGGGA